MALRMLARRGAGLPASSGQRLLDSALRRAGLATADPGSGGAGPAGASGAAQQAAADDRQPGGNAGVDAAEVGKFSAMAARWWDPAGPMAPLHSMNPTRVRFIRSALCDHFGRDAASPQPFQGLRLADVGSGGGLLSEALARLGADVTGVDASEAAAAVAAQHAAADPALAARLRYRMATAERLAEEGARFDAVVASEVIEHVPDPEGFCAALAAITAPGGALVISTLNRTPRAYALAVLGAERLLRLLPVGTHEWGKFIAPDELAMLLQPTGMRLVRVSGMSLRLTSGRWALTDDLGVNYIASFAKA